MTSRDVFACFSRYAAGAPGLLEAAPDGTDLLARTRAALMWAIAATDAEPRNGWVWNGYAEKRVNPYRVADYLAMYRRQHGQDERYLWARIAVSITSGAFDARLWLHLHRIRPVRAEWVVYHALYAAKDSPSIHLRPVLVALRLWSEAAPIIERVLERNDGYIERFGEPFFTREWAATLMRQLLGCVPASERGRSMSTA